jgi:GxxExxY protein
MDLTGGNKECRGSENQKPLCFPLSPVKNSSYKRSLFAISDHKLSLLFPPMHPLFTKASELTTTVIAAAIEVHRNKGPGLIESLYEWCLLKELWLRGLECISQKIVVIEYKGFTREEPLRFDLLVKRCLLLETKAVQAVLPIHKAQVLSCMNILDVPLGLLINFHELRLTNGIHRLILRGANEGSAEQLDTISL